MRKILTVISVLSLISFNANALERGDISATIGVAANSAVYGASAKETNRDDSSNIRRTASESGVFTESHTSGFIELNVGQFVSLGYEHTPDSITTPTNTTRHGNPAGENNVSVDFNDLNIAYLKLNTPFGVYLKAGVVETDLDIKESMGSGSTYKNVSTEGTIMGIGYNKAFTERLSVRFEGSYMELDDVTTSNGVAADGATTANSGRNQIDASNLEGLNGKIAITLTLGN